MAGLVSDNLRRLESIGLHNMTTEEMVQADSQVESRFHFSEGVWWRQVKPFFYQPAFFMTRIVPQEAEPKPWLALGGYYHMVPEALRSNGVIAVYEIENLKGYALENLKKKSRYEVRRALGMLEIKPVDHLDELLNDGYRIYLSWERKTCPKVRRSDPRVFQRWTRRSFNHPYTLILGAYYQGHLVAYSFAHAVEGVAEITRCFTDIEFYKTCSVSPAKALTYAYVTIGRQNPNIKKVCNGLTNDNRLLAEFKTRLGFRAVSYPAWIHLRSGVKPLVRWWMPREYRLLMGTYETDVSSQRETA